MTTFNHTARRVGQKGFTPYRGCTPCGSFASTSVSQNSSQGLAKPYYGFSPYRGCSGCRTVSSLWSKLSTTSVKPQRGFTLLIAVLVVSIIRAIGISILTITLKEYVLSRVARQSVIALNAADAGMECARYWDHSTQGNKFDVAAPPSNITCMEQTHPTGGGVSGTPQEFTFSWGAPEVCAKVSVTKYFSTSGVAPMGDGRNCPQGVECTRVVSLGYDKACADINTPRTVERGLRALY